MGFEPTLELPLNTLSKRAPSATRPSLRLIGRIRSRELYYCNLRNRLRAQSAPRILWNTFPGVPRRCIPASSVQMTFVRFRVVGGANTTTHRQNSFPEAYGARSRAQVPAGQKHPACRTPCVDNSSPPVPWYLPPARCPYCASLVSRRR